MATIATSPASVKVHRPVKPANDRRFYTGMSVVMALTVLAGFAPTYYGKILGSAPLHTVSNAPFSWVVHLHGALFSAWVLLFVVQTGLIATHRVAVHRTLGIVGGVLASCMVAAGLTVAVEAFRRGSAAPGTTPTQFFAIPFFDMVLFGAFVGLALWYRKNKEAHKRLMLLAYISIITAATARLPGVLPHGPLAFYGITMIFLAAAVIYDVVSRRRLHPAYVWGGAAFVLSIPLRLMISSTAVWSNLIETLIR